MIQFFVALVILYLLYKFFLSSQQSASRNDTVDGNWDREIENIQAVFPNIHKQDLLQDLQRTRSIEQTMENILTGKLLPSSSSASSSSTKNITGSSSNVRKDVNAKLEQKKDWTEEQLSTHDSMQRLKQQMIALNREKYLARKSKGKEKSI